MPGSGARLSLGARATLAGARCSRVGVGRRALSRAAAAAATAFAAAAAVGLGRRLSGAGRGAGGEGGGGEGGGPGGKMPLAQLADPWQKMAVESPSDSAEVSVARRQGPARPLPSPPPAGSPPRSWPLAPSSAARVSLSSGLWDSGSGSWGWSVCPSVLPTRTFPPSLEGLWWSGAWDLEWALGLCKKPILINFAWGKREAERGPGKSWEVWPCLIGDSRGPRWL